MFVQQAFLKAIWRCTNLGELFASRPRKGFYASYAGRKPIILAYLTKTKLKKVFNMKKFLMGTTALIGAATIASTAEAAGPDVTVGGFIDFQASFADSDNGFDTTDGSDRDLDRDSHFQNDTEVHILVDGKTDNGLGYGAVIELEADVDGGNLDDGSESGSGNADKTYIYLESSVGRVEAGNNVGAAQSLSIGAESIARATGGIKGDFHRYVDVGQDDSGGFATPSILYVPALPSEVDFTIASGAGNSLVDQEESTKLTYFTPRVSGFQAGASFSLDNGDFGSAAGLSSEANADQYENLWSLGANYEGDFEGVGIRVGATGEFGEAETSANEDIAAYQVGAEVSFQGFSLAASYGDNDDSRSGTTTATSSGDVTYWTAGAAYETGPFGVSVTYLDSEAEGTTQTSSVGDDEFTNLVIGVDYSLAPGLTPYVEAAFFEAEEGLASGSNSNDGSVVLIGTQLNF